ncbi:sigma-70-like protein [Thermosporothrix hazakensis]|uniref:Sigma-70-like protein n=1 Tax=Thermosporothrix hazakensis TaxID=644383 RepID=A0A326UF58_THEHA|nr:sigma-70 family RNA polymerase sigma factor [Thermosporothrix hazakensis]PZW36664.1 sigma-70-like protein [Thermosporothrix hazakensis]GCE47315.1 hypothetical protein KTH_21840 [Thermosporothrix hazakensis]
MTYQKPQVPSDYSAPSLNSVLVELEPVIRVMLKHANCSLNDWEQDEIAQCTLYKLARALASREISNLHGYLKRTIHNEFVSYLRSTRPWLSLHTTEEGEPCTGTPLISLSQGWDDPALEYEHRASFQELLDLVVDAIMELPPVQRYATICYFNDIVDDRHVLIASFQRYNLDITPCRWPQERADKQKLLASFYAARSTLIRHLSANPHFSSDHPFTCFHVRRRRK